ncbi:MAG: type II toxin-antitoxin system ParD family antitoxin [Pirellulales bacterium]
MNISLPAPLKSWIEQQVEERGYSTASEFVRDVLRREQEQAARAAVDARLLQAIDSGESTPMTATDWKRIRTEGLERAQSIRNSQPPRKPASRRKK